MRYPLSTPLLGPLRKVRTAYGFDLQVEREKGRFETVAIVQATGDKEAEIIANRLSAAFLLYQVVDEILEFLQPDGWGDGTDPGQDALWRAIFRAHLTADGEEIPPQMLEPEPANPA